MLHIAHGKFIKQLQQQTAAVYTHMVSAQMASVQMTNAQTETHGTHELHVVWVGWGCSRRWETGVVVWGGGERAGEEMEMWVMG